VHSYSSVESSPNCISNSNGTLNNNNNKGGKSPLRRSLRSSKSASYLPIQNEIEPAQREPSSVEKLDVNRRGPERKTSFNLPGNNNNIMNSTEGSSTISKRGKDTDPLSQSENNERHRSNKKEKSRSDKKKKKRSMTDEDMKKIKPVKSSNELVSISSSKENMSGTSSNLTRSLSNVTKSSTNSLLDSNK